MEKQSLNFNNFTITRFYILCCASVLFVACVIPSHKRSVSLPKPVDIHAKSIATAYKSFFTFGSAVEPSHLTTVEPILKTQFNRLTCENHMKMQFIQPQEGVFTFGEADQIADYARKHKMKMTGHALLWHRSTPQWVFSGLTKGEEATVETLKTRLREHIGAVIPRYNDVVDNWDVVNEAISDDAAKTFRDASEGSQWQEYFGGDDNAGREYVYWTFAYAKEALEKIAPGNSKGKLYYNDYNVNLKTDRILKLLIWLRDEKGLKIDGVGLQGHWQMSWPSVTQIEQTIDAFVKEGFLVKISELDITLYSDYTAEGQFTPAPEVEFTAQLEAQQAKRYGDLFTMFRKRAAHITSVTMWGVGDDHTWLSNFPVPNRDNRPLLFNKEHQAKAAVHSILDF